MDGPRFATWLSERITHDAIQETMIRLLEVPSPQTERMEAEPQVLAFIRDAVEPKLRSIGLRDIAYDSMGNLCGTYGKATSGRRLLLVCNAMNQPPGSMPDPYKPRVVDGAPYGLPGRAVIGRGASEQKATMAAMLHAIEATVQSDIGVTGELTVLCCTSGETGKHDAIMTAIDEFGIHADMAIIGGASLKVSLGNRGRIDVLSTVKGAPCHSSRPFEGCNAITGAQLLMAQVLENATLPAPHPLVGQATLTPTHIESFPKSTHTVQERCELVFDRRLLPGEDPDSVFKAISAQAAEITNMVDPVSGRNFKVETRKGPFMYPSLVEPGAPVVQALLRASHAALGTSPELIYSYSAFDQGYLNHIGIPTVNYGPGEYEYAHTDHDMASIERTRDAARVYAYLVYEQLADGADDRVGL